MPHGLTLPAAAPKTPSDRLATCGGNELSGILAPSQTIHAGKESQTIDVSIAPQLTMPTAETAIAHVNRWLHQQVGIALQATSATFDPLTYYWHVPVELAYGATGLLGQVGDVYIHAATGQFAGHPNAKLFQQRAEALADAPGIE